MKRFLGVLSGLGAWILSVAIFVGISFLFIGGAKVANWIEPWVRLFSALTFLIVLPISLLLLIFRKSRAWGGLGIYLISWPLGLWLWLVSLLYALGVSVFWAVAGVVMGGLGVIPVAAIMTLFRRDWANFGALVGNSVVVFLLRWLGLWIVNRASERDMEKQRGEAFSARPHSVLDPSESSPQVREIPDLADIADQRKAAQQDFDRAMRDFEAL